jgi:ATP-dependent exoDNAse (exonuclease V) beta subunit
MRKQKVRFQNNGIAKVNANAVRLASSFANTSFLCITANFVVDNILDMVATSAVKPDDTVALIYRTNAQSRHLEEACVKKGLNYVIRGAAGGFYKRAEIKDCLCFLRWLNNGHDQSAMLRALKTPTKGIGDVATKEFQEYCAEIDSFYREVCPSEKRPTPFDILISLTDGETSAPSMLAQGSPEATTFITKRALNKFLPFSRQMRSVRQKAYEMPVDFLLFYIIEELDLGSHFDSISKSKAEFEERRQNVQELRQATKRYAKNGSALNHTSSVGSDGFENNSPLSNFLDDVALVTDIKGDAETTSGEKRLVVNLMTIHASKGMEFDAVFVVGNEDGTFPSNQALQEGDGSIALEEEKRLCYVAMTRAKTQLIMTWRKEVTMFSSWSDDGPRTTDKTRSRFLDVLVSKKSGSKSSGKLTDNLLRPRSTNSPVPSRGISRSFSSTSFSSSDNGSTRSTSSPRPASRESSSSQKPWQKKSQWNQPKESEPIHPTLSARRASSILARNREAVEGGKEKPVAKAVPRDTSAMESPQRPTGTNGTRQPPGSVSRIKPIVNGATTSRVPPASNDQTGGTAGRSNVNGPVNPRQASRPNTRSSPPKARQAESTTMDSTWFFPVGSQVVHRNFGRGKVLQPPPPSESKNLLVRIEFENGKQMEFPAAGADISPDLGPVN